MGSPRIFGTEEHGLAFPPAYTCAPPFGVDIGGTFTDIVLLDENGVLRNKKILSSPDDYSRAIEEGVRELLNTTGVKAGEIVELAHGTTVATNAIIERKGVTVALITTAGFRDVLEIARFRAPRLYDVNFRKPDPLVERRLRFTVPERITASGEVDKPLDIAALIAVADRGSLELAQHRLVLVPHAGLASDSGASV